MATLMRHMEAMATHRVPPPVPCVATRFRTTAVNAAAEKTVGGNTPATAGQPLAEMAAVRQKVASMRNMKAMAVPSSVPCAATRFLTTAVNAAADQTVDGNTLAAAGQCSSGVARTREVIPVRLAELVSHRLAPLAAGANEQHRRRGHGCARTTPEVAHCGPQLPGVQHLPSMCWHHCLVLHPSALQDKRRCDQDKRQDARKSQLCASWSRRTP